MSTVAQLIDRVKRDWLELGDDQPIRATLNTTINTSTTTVIYDPELLSPEEADLLGPGTLLEIDSEEVLVTDVDEDANTLTVKRAVNGTTAAAHTAGAFITLTPTWRRKVIFDALADAVVQLWPGVYRIANSVSMSVSGTTFTEVLIADAPYMIEPVGFVGRSSSGYPYETFGVTPLMNFPGSTTSKAFYVPALAGGGTGYLQYKAKFARPTAEADNLTTTLGVNEEWEQIVIITAVAYLIAGRELDSVTQERLSEQLEQQGYPAGRPSQIRDGLLRYREFLMRIAKDGLRVANKVTVNYRSAV
jgi:hypothetical protein